MKKLLFSIFVLLLASLPWSSSAQRYDQQKLDSLFSKRGEVYFKCILQNPEDIHFLTRVISISDVKGNELYAYANQKEFSAFLQYNLKFTILPYPGTTLSESELNPYGTQDNLQNIHTWDFYPTYEQYISYMVGFASTYPEICKLDTIGNTVEGRLILAVKISRNVNQDEAEPQFLYTSSIHGNETTGYILMLHLIDYMLSNYGIDSAVTHMVNTTEILINPLANPDGTYHGGNNSVLGATRVNANGVDLNRNFLDPKTGAPPDPYQTETLAWMAYADMNHFTQSANFHDGVEVFNYPWDTYSKLTADDSWWKFVGREWADTIHKYAPAGYFTFQNNGITNGWQWYEVNGGRQDYMNFFHNCREVTVELSGYFLIPPSLLPNYWNYNYRTFLNYIKEVNYGFHGIVTDTVTNQPVAAKVFITAHDLDNSEVYSKLPTGFYARPIYEGNYNVTFSAPNYFSKTIYNVNVLKRATTVLDVQLRPLTYGLHDNIVNSLSVFPNPSDGKFRIMLPENPVNSLCSVQVINTLGNVVYSSALNIEKVSNTAEIDIPNLPEGFYFIKFISGNRIYSDKLIIKR